MSFNDGIEIDPGRVSDRRGPGGGVIAGGGISVLGLILALIFGPQILDQGQDPSGAGGGTSQNQPQNQQGGKAPDASKCRTGADANASDDCRIIATAESLDEFWKQELPAQGVRFRQPEIVLFSQGVRTGCGNASSAVGPFYCPSDSTAYFDTTFFKELSTRFGGSDGPLAQEYIVAHEYGHHIQRLTGGLGGSQRDPQGAESAAVRTELQADCYSGLWAGHAARTKDPQTGQTFMKPLTRQDVNDALSAAASVGDDRIQEQTNGRVDQDSWTHGSSAQRQAWFVRGYQSSSMGACNTFAARDLNSPGA